METITSTHADKIAALIDEASRLDEQVAAFAEALHRVQRDVEAELQEQPFYTAGGDQDVDGQPEAWFQAVRIVELRTWAGAMEHRLQQALDELEPGARASAVQRHDWARHGIGGFAIDQERQA